MNEEQAMYSVASPAELPEIAGLLQRNRLLALARTGVEIYDASSRKRAKEKCSSSACISSSRETP